MANFPHLEKAPIREAIIDIQVQLAPEINVTQLQSLHDQIKGDYPQKSERRRWESKLEFKDGKPQEPESLDMLSGYAFTSADKTQVAQFRLDGFTFSRLQPYTKWDQFSSEAKKLWSTYSSISTTTPPQINRVAVRYINILDLSLPINSFEEFITGLPQAPTTRSLLLKSFLNRIEVLDASQKLNAIVTEGLLPPSKPSVATLLLDIDVFKAAPFESPYDDAWNTIEAAKVFENEMFFNIITEKTKELYK